MSTFHTVTLPDGTVATRTSEKHLYSHAIAIGPEPREEVVDRKERDLARIISQERSCQSVLDYIAAGGELVLKPSGGTLFAGTVHAPGLPNDDPYRGLGWVSGSNNQFMMKDGDTLAEQVTAWFSGQIVKDRAADRRAEIAEIAAGPELIGPWRVFGWSSRLKLAEQRAAKAGGRGREVRILETVLVTK